MKITYCISVFLASLVTFMAQALPGPTSATFDKGALFTTDKASDNYKEFVEAYEPLRDKMVEWLNDKEDC